MRGCIVLYEDLYAFCHLGVYKLAESAHSLAHINLAERGERTVEPWVNEIRSALSLRVSAGLNEGFIESAAHLSVVEIESTMKESVAL